MKLTYAEVYHDAVTIKGERLLPSGGEPEAVYDFMVECVIDNTLIEDEHEKEIDELNEEIEALEKDYDRIFTKHENSIELLKYLAFDANGDEVEALRRITLCLEQNS